MNKFSAALIFFTSVLAGFSMASPARASEPAPVNIITGTVIRASETSTATQSSSALYRPDVVTNDTVGGIDMPLDRDVIINLDLSGWARRVTKAANASAAIGRRPVNQSDIRAAARSIPCSCTMIMIRGGIRATSNLRNETVTIRVVRGRIATSFAVVSK